MAPDLGVALGRRLLSTRPVLWTRPGVPQESWGPSREVLRTLGISGALSLSEAEPRTRDAVRTLVSLGAVIVDVDYTVRLASEGLVWADGEVLPTRLLALLRATPGGGGKGAPEGERARASHRAYGRVIRVPVAGLCRS